MGSVSSVIYGNLTNCVWSIIRPLAVCPHLKHYGHHIKGNHGHYICVLSQNHHVVAYIIAFSPQRGHFFPPISTAAVVNINAHFKCKAHISKHRLHCANSSLKSEYINSEIFSSSRCCVKNHATSSQYRNFKSLFIKNDCSWSQVHSGVLRCHCFLTFFSQQIFPRCTNFTLNMKL